jgi:hypothetical protein
LFLLAFVTLAGCGIFPYPTDQAMEEKFRSDEVSFHRLVEMFKDDSQLSSVNNKAAYMSFDHNADLPKQRMDEYQSLLKKLGLLVVSRGEKTGNIYMKAWHRNAFLIGGSSKYYVYAENSPEALVDSLDKLENGDDDAYAFKKISDNWYMHLDIW